MTIADSDTSKYPYDKIKIVFKAEWDEMRALHINGVNELELEIWDKITVDSEKRRVYLENVDGTSDITGLVTAGSERPVLQGWNNQIWIDVWVRDTVISADIKRNKVF
jgi:hypothetical protein